MITRKHAQLNLQLRSAIKFSPDLSIGHASRRAASGAFEKEFLKQSLNDKTTARIDSATNVDRQHVSRRTETGSPVQYVSTKKIVPRPAHPSHSPPAPTSTKQYLESYSWLKDATELRFDLWQPRESEDVLEHLSKIHVSHNAGAATWGHNLDLVYLRDSCSCSQCRHSVTQQKLVDSFSIPMDIRILEREQSLDLIKFKWSDGHISQHKREWFQALRTPILDGGIWRGRYRQWYDPKADLEIPSVPYRSVMDSDDGVRTYLNLIGEYGFCFVDGCPIDPDATQKLLERIAFIRVTHYGGFYDFTSNLSSKDTAYTDLALEPHTDNTYFTDPSGLQMLHLLSHTEGSGGLSTLVDGFKVAEDLRQEDYTSFKVLSKIQQRFHASGNEDLGSITPMIQHRTIEKGKSHGLFENGGISRICWNNSDRASFPPGHVQPADTVWYAAAKVFNSMVKSDKYLWQFQLEPGRPLIFDNWRMLHGRTAFTGKRRMCGGYINMDDFVAKWKLLNFGQEMIKNSI